MLVPLTRQKFEQLIPLIATGSQYKYYWGKFPDFLQRLLISVVAAAIVLIIKVILRIVHFGPIIFLVGLTGAFYWLWGPVFWASIRNAKCRRYKYSGFFRGRILDWWITDEVLGKQETVNTRGELVIVENREKRINLEVGDETGFTAQMQAPLKADHRAIATGQRVEMLVMSNRTDLSRIEDISEIFIPGKQLWVNDYPYLRRDLFMEMSRRLRESPDRREPRRRRPREPRRNRDWEDY
ncbi:MAG: phosphate ABC transporter permease [Calothrix sp. MO_192.B10]|nr:phosphate ABC transporter permease [Calothrix sp. MO_192.B10]